MSVTSCAQLDGASLSLGCYVFNGGFIVLTITELRETTCFINRVKSTRFGKFREASRLQDLKEAGGCSMSAQSACALSG